jgi:hypothetical protein
MHGFNTFPVEGFHYPNCCARCAGEEPTQSWRIVQSVIEFPEGMPAGPWDQKPRNYNDYVTNVPICDKCHAALQSRSRKCWLVGAAVGAVAALATFQYLFAAEIKLQGCLLSGGAAGVAVALVLGWLLKLIAVDGFSFAKLDGLAQRITFKNKAYQAEFDRLNFTAPRGQVARGW